MEQMSYYGKFRKKLFKLKDISFNIFKMCKYMHIYRYIFYLMQIFLDMAVLVDAQGDMLDNIESQVWRKKLLSLGFF